jgi:hypothetical protein
MTKEEQWKREAEIKLDELDDRGFDFDNWSISDAYERGYCDCAEPREKRIAELKETVIKMNNVIIETFSNLTKAKEIIKKIEKIVYSGENEIKRLSKIVDILAETEQFIK